MKNNLPPEKQNESMSSAFDSESSTMGKSLAPPAFQLRASGPQGEGVEKSAAENQVQNSPVAQRAQANNEAPIHRNATNALIGAGVGAMGGAAIGAGIGSIIPGLGTGAGAIVGGLVGGLVGGIAGALTGNKSQLETDLEKAISDGKLYADIKAIIQAASGPQRATALANQALLKSLKAHLGWEDFSRTCELLGRVIPTYADLIANPTVTAELANAWTASNPQVPNIAAGLAGHEEGGWIFLNLITGAVSTRRGPTGGQANVNLDAHPTVADSVIIGVFHTHPNLGPGWAPGPSPADITIDARDGIPDIVVGSPDTDPATYQFYQSGPASRLHLGGGQGYPGNTGGNRPQSSREGEEVMTR